MDQHISLETAGRAASIGISHGLEQLTAKDVMQFGVVSIDRKEPVYKAVSLLLERNISALPVTDEGRLTGMLSERDLLRLVHKTEYLPGVVEDYMATNVTSADVDDSLASISRKLADSAFRRVPVLLNRQTLAGIITRTELIRAYKEQFRPPTCTPQPTRDAKLLAQDVMIYGLLTLAPDAPLYDAMNLITRHHITGLPVVDETMHLLGIITQKDVLNYCLRPFPADTTVAAFMTTGVVAFDPKADLDRITECLVEKDFHRVPILDQGRLVGIISRSDILRNRAAAFRR